MNRLVVALTALVFALGTNALAQEHPEQAKKEHPEKTEHPEKAEHPESAQEMTLETLAAAITHYIEHDTKLKGGFFLIADAEEKKVLQLELVKVHKDRLASLGNGVYFACTDMKAANGTVYDLDFFMKQTGPGIETTEVAIHKKAAKPRYNWKEEDGIWKKVKV